MQIARAIAQWVTRRFESRNACAARRMREYLKWRNEDIRKRT